MDMRHASTRVTHDLLMLAEAKLDMVSRTLFEPRMS